MVHYLECCRSSVENEGVMPKIEMESEIVQTEVQNQFSRLPPNPLHIG